MTELDTSQLDAAFSALAHPVRRAMLHDLAFRPATVSQLARDHQVSLPAMYKHLQVFEEAGLIIRKKVGRTNFVTLSTITLRALQAYLGQYHAEWGNDQETLDNYIAGLQNS